MPSSRAAPPRWVAAVNGLSTLFGVAAAGLILVSVGVVCQMVFVRAVLNESSIWQTEFVTFSLVAATFLGAPYILLTHGHVGVDVLPLMLSTPGRRMLGVIGLVLMLGFCGFFLYAAIPWWYDSWKSGLTTSSIWRARMWIPYLSVPVGLALMCLQLVARLHGVLTQREAAFALGTGETH